MKNKRYIRRAKKLYGKYLNQKPYCDTCKNKNTSICFNCETDECNSCALYENLSCFFCCKNSLRELYNSIKFANITIIDLYKRRRI